MKDAGGERATGCAPRSKDDFVHAASGNRIGDGQGSLKCEFTRGCAPRIKARHFRSPMYVQLLSSTRFFSSLFFFFSLPLPYSAIDENRPRTIIASDFVSLSLVPCPFSKFSNWPRRKLFVSTWLMKWSIEPGFIQLITTFESRRCRFETFFVNRTN